MFCVGLTGLIGSGKSTVGGVFCGLGIPLYDCDSAAKTLMLCDLRTSIEAQFGEESYLEGGELNRQFLAAKVFSDSEQRHRLEAIVHPAVDADLHHWIAAQHGAPYVVVESAILFDNVIERSIDYMVVTSADYEVIVARVMRRDGSSRAQVEQRLAAQMEPSAMIKRADSVIFTSEQELVVPKVVALHEKLLTLLPLKTKKS